MNGAPPIFQAEKVKGEVKIAGLPEEGGQKAVRQALADLLGVDASQIVLPDWQDDDQSKRRGTTRAIVFEIVGDASRVASLSQVINAGNLASQLSSQLSDQFGMKITVEVSGSHVGPREGWVVVGGEYFLRSCPRGFVLLNTTVETQECRECAVGFFNIDPLRGCTALGSLVRCDARPCSVCPESVDCNRGSAPVWSHFVPKPLHLGESVLPWVTVVQPSGFRSRLFCDGTKKTCAPPELANNKQAISAIPIRDLEHHLWEEVNGVFLLRKCPPGFKLISTPIEMQKCSPCGKGKYIIEGSTDCVDCPVFFYSRFNAFPPQPTRSLCPTHSLCASSTLTCCLTLAQDGANCPDGAQFEPKVVGSVWMAETVGATGVRTYRISACPAGHALVRTRNNPLADNCERCPGTEQHGYNIDGAQWIAPGPMGLNDWCKPCPLPKGT